MKRILVIGCGGAGKSTLAKKLHEKTGLPLVHLDLHYWQPGWQRPEHDSWLQKTEELAKEESWIMDGDYPSALHARLPYANMVVFLDPHPLVCAWRVIKRTLERKGQNHEIAPGCPERLDWEFLSYILWRFPRRKRPYIKQLLKKHTETKPVHTLKTKKEIKRFLQKF